MRSFSIGGRRIAWPSRSNPLRQGHADRSGVPKTMTTDVDGTISTFRVRTAVSTAIEAIDKLHTTAESHDRVIVMEGDGAERRVHRAALRAPQGALDVILIPGFRRHRPRVRQGARAGSAPAGFFSIIVTAREPSRRRCSHTRIGASLPGEMPRLGGVAARSAGEIQGEPGKETRFLFSSRASSSAGGWNPGYDRRFLWTPLRRGRRARGRGWAMGPHGGSSSPAHRDESRSGSPAPSISAVDPDSDVA